jgi:7,8-dihydropterin-6-yl-methyl-4-(beta-D-ribofuranosyl)aminobenzene 5'-phosphate synthase
VYGHTDIFAQRIWSKDNVTRDIGIPFRRSYLESLGAKFQLGTEVVEVGPGVYLTGEIPRQSSFEKGDGAMTRIEGNGQKIHPDPLLDDLSMLVDTDKGLVIVLGCAHAGMINIINYAIEKLHTDRIFAVIGGTHLGFADDLQFEETLKVIDNYNIEHIGVPHCTGLEKASRLHARLGKRFFFGTVGAVLEG